MQHPIVIKPHHRPVICGIPRGKLRFLTLEQRFDLYVEKSEGCWTWKGEVDRDGYGRFSEQIKHGVAPSTAYAAIKGSAWKTVP